MSNLTKLMIVDKNALELVGLKSLFDSGKTEIHAETSVVLDKLEARIQQWNPDVILIDFNTCEEEIDDLTRQLKKIHPDMKIIWLLSEDLDLVKYDAISARADGCVPKTDFEKISQAVEVAVGGDVYYPRRLLADFAYEATLVLAHLGRRINLLSDREKEVLEYIRSGATNEEIAEGLLISVETVKAHIRRIREILGVTNRRQLISGLRPARKGAAGQRARTGRSKITAQKLGAS